MKDILESILNVHGLAHDIILDFNDLL